MTPLSRRRPRLGFTLIEMSMVLVIIGLISGAILVARDMIRLAQLRSVITTQDKYLTAIYTFRLKYNGLPGDMSNATAFWGEADANPIVCKTTIGTGTQTCNGDGNSVVGNGYIASMQYEQFRLWQHLSNAGLIPGVFTGVAGPGGTHEAVIGTNVPESAIRKAGFTFFDFPHQLGDATHFDEAYGHVLDFGGFWAGWETVAPAITGTDALYIENKMDDGKPGTGKVMTYKQGTPWVPNCATTNNPATAEYNGSDSVICALIFLRTF